MLWLLVPISSFYILKLYLEPLLKWRKMKTFLTGLKILTWSVDTELSNQLPSPVSAVLKHSNIEKNTRKLVFTNFSNAQNALFAKRKKLPRKKKFKLT